MNYLLDTQVLLWYIAGSAALRPYARRLIEQPGAQLHVSVASLWETAIKLSLGKLSLGMSFVSLVEDYLPARNVDLIPIHTSHLIAVSSLPLYHRDPFDRLIIAQALVEGWPVISSDAAFDLYPVQRVW